MGKMYFPSEKPAKKVERFINRFDGTLTERYQNENGKTVEDHYRLGAPLPLDTRTIYTGKSLDKANRETIYFEGVAGEEKPRLKRVYEDNVLRVEQGLNGALDQLNYEENYTYRYDELGLPSGRPSTTVRTEYYENGNPMSLIVEEEGKGITKHVEYANDFKKPSTLRNTIKKVQRNNMQAVISRTQQRINERK